MPMPLLGVLLAIHGLIHGVGFTTTWGLGASGAISGTPTLWPGVTWDEPVVRGLGVLWLVALVGYVGAAIEAFFGSGLWLPLAVAASLLSLALCVLWWSDAKIGALLDVAILAGIVATRLFVLRAAA